jgi:hypothetical protein
VALAVVALLVFTCLQFKITFDYGLKSFVFFGSVTGYNFVKYAPVAKLHHRSLTNQLRQIQIFSFCCFLGLCVSAFFVNYKVLFVCGVLGLLTLLYAIPIQNKNLRETSVLKVFIIALIWATVSFVLPFLQENALANNINSMWWFNYTERFIWILLLMIPFEIRDVRFDETYLKTLVSIFGIPKIKMISVLVLIALATHKYFGNSYQHNLTYIIIYMSLTGFILASKKVQKPYFASFWVEALPIFWVITWYLFNVSSI